jgi:hypothetical protein
MLFLSFVLECGCSGSSLTEAFMTPLLQEGRSAQCVLIIREIMLKNQ